jgi:hypothetical protein
MIRGSALDQRQALIKGRFLFTSRHAITIRLQFPFAGGKPAAYFARRLRMSQLAKQHGYKLLPTGETQSVALGIVFEDRAFTFQARKKLQDLREYAGYSIQG